MKFNQLFIKYVAGLLITKIILMLLILGYTMYAYGYFTVNRVIIIGNKRISKNEIFKRTGLVIGESTTLFLNSTLEKELDKNAWVISSHVEKELPDYIYIEIMEEDIFCLYKEQEDNIYDFILLELSSFQLQGIKSFKPHICYSASLPSFP